MGIIGQKFKISIFQIEIKTKLSANIIIWSNRLLRHNHKIPRNKKNLILTQKLLSYMMILQSHKISPSMLILFMNRYIMMTYMINKYDWF